MNNLRAQEWYNGQVPRYLSGYMNDKSNRLIGWATMRQLRIKPHSCSIPSLVSQCTDVYDFFNEERRSFHPGWSTENLESYTSTIHRSFEYQSDDELDTYVYLGEHANYNSGGYVYEYRGRLVDLKSNLSQLHRLSWIDNRTRAVIIQLNLYNPNVQLFTSVSLLMEFLPTGGLEPHARFEPFYFQSISFFFDFPSECFSS